MLKRLFKRIELLIRPPREGDVYYADPTMFVLAKRVEYILHNLVDKYGATLYEPVPSDYCYRLTVSSCSMLPKCYVLDSEVFCRGTDYMVVLSNNIGEWKKRSQPKKIGKELFEHLIIMGILRRI